MTALQTLLAGLIDYAGLFPPAGLDMRTTAENYSRYLRDPYSASLGRLVVPATRLGELDAVASDLFPRDGAAWRIAALMGQSPSDDAAVILRFNCAHWEGSERGHVIVDTVEARIDSAGDAVALRAMLPNFYTMYAELPQDARIGSSIAALKAAGVRAKLRTGGVTADAFPEAMSVLDFLSACVERELPFKLTAGLHHAVSGDYPLTHEAGSEHARMFGFLNGFLAAAALVAGCDTDVVRAIIEETDARAFSIADDGISWRDVTLTDDHLRSARRLAVSFGSCSFLEPVTEITAHE